MKTQPSTPSFVMKVLAALAAFTVLAALPMQAQTTHTYIGTGDNNTAGQWETTTNWDTTTIPGSLLGGAVDDIVIIRNNLSDLGDPPEVHQIRLASDVGEIESLRIGGPTVPGITGNAQLSLRAGALMAINGDVILGSTEFGGQRGGQINFQNGSTTVTVFGNVLSGSAGGGNNINVNQGTASKFELLGDIDSTPARIAAGLDPGLPGTAAGGNQQIDLVISRNEGVDFLGTDQVLNLESLFIGHTGANIGTIQQTLPFGLTVNAVNGRIGSVNNNNRTASSTLIVDGATVNYTNFLTVGRGANASNNNNAVPTGTLTVGDFDPGTVTVNGPLNLADQLENDAGNAQVVTGIVNVTNGSLTANAGVNMGTNVQPGGSIFATVNVNGGTMTVTGAILEIDNTTVTNSTLNLTDGELELLDALGGTRDVDELNFTGGTLDFTVYGGMPTFGTQDTTLSATPAGSTIDVTTAAGGTTFSVNDFVTWIGGTPGPAPDGEWSAALGTNWDGGLTPSGGFGPIGAGENFVVISSVNPIGGDAAAAVLTPGALSAGWVLTQNANDITLTAGAPIAGGVAGALFDDPAADVTRLTDLNLEAAAGTGADATQIDIDDINSLAITGNLNVGGATAGAVVNQGIVGGGATGGMAVTVSGGLNLADDGFYNLNEGTLTVAGGSATGAAMDGELVINSPVPNSFSSTGPLTVGPLTVGQDPGTNASITIDYALITKGKLQADGTGLDQGAVTIGEDGDAQGSITIASGGSLTTSGVGPANEPLGRLIIAGDQTGNQDAATSGSLTLEAGGSLTVNGGNLEVGRDGMGTFTINGGTYDQSTNNLVLGQNGADPDTAAKGFMFINGGTITIGDVANTLVNNNININAGGGSITQVAGDVIIDNALNLVDQGDQDSAYTITGGTLDIRGALAYRNSGVTPHTGSDTVTIGGTAVVTVGGNIAMNTPSGNNTLIIDGSGCSVTAGGFQAGNMAIAKTVQFNLDGGGVSPISVGGTCNLSAANILLGGTISDTTAGDFELFDVAGDVSNTTSTFGLVDGQPLLVFGDGSGYVVSINEVESGNDGNDVWALATAVVPAIDTDGDGMDDVYEIINFGDLSRDGTADFDVDGTSDLDEFLFGTDPTDPNSVFTIAVTAVDAGGGTVDVTYGPIFTGLTYVLEASPDGVAQAIIDTFIAGADAPSNTVIDAGVLPAETFQVEVFGNEITP